MKEYEFKKRMISAMDDLIDVYFADDNFIDKVTNSTLKVAVELNINKMDGLLNMMCDEKGEIDEITIVNAYANNIGPEGISFNLKNYIKNDFIRGILPDKTLIINKEDVLKIIENEPNEEGVH